MKPGLFLSESKNNERFLAVRSCSIFDQNNSTIGFLSGSDGKESACNAGDPGSIPGSGRSLEKEMATHSSILAWRIPWTEEAGRLQSMGCKESDMTERLSLHFTLPRVRHMSSRKSCEECHRIPKKGLYSQNPWTHVPNAHRCHHQAPHQIQRGPHSLSQHRLTCPNLHGTSWWLPDNGRLRSDLQIKSVCQELSEKPGWNNLETVSIILKKVYRYLMSNRLVCTHTHTHTFYCFKLLGTSSHFFTMYILNSYVSRYNKYNLLTLN